MCGPWPSGGGTAAALYLPAQEPGATPPAFSNPKATAHKGRQPEESMEQQTAEVLVTANTHVSGPRDVLAAFHVVIHVILKRM